MPVKPTVRNRPEAQGFCGPSDATLEKLAPWMRWTYTIGTLVTVIGVAFMSPVVLWALAAITSVGIFLPFHPFDLVYNYGVRYLTGTAAFPRSGPQRRFVFAVATVWLVATGWAFHIGANFAGMALGVALILVGALASTTHFCIPSFIYYTVLRRRNEPTVTGGV
jgi:Domain of unknown function (DUF4395)